MQTSPLVVGIRKRTGADDKQTFAKEGDIELVSCTLGGISVRVVHNRLMDGKRDISRGDLEDLAFHMAESKRKPRNP